MHPYLTVIISCLGFLASITASSHIIMYKRDSRSAALWVALVWLVPFLGSLLYILLGINRVERRARRRKPDPRETPATTAAELLAQTEEHEGRTRARTAHLTTLATLVRRVSGVPLLDGNAISLLKTGEEAYPAMIAAIESAEHSVGLCSYIFDHDLAGRDFALALQRAHKRGVDVRVLIDAVGARYSWPSMVKHLRRLDLHVAVFNPTRLFFGRFRYANMRNHRKILVVDGRLGFTGGMNIREGCLLDSAPSHPIQDLHLSVNGPVTAHLVRMARG